MEKELQKLTKNQLVQLVENFEHYPTVSMKDDKGYIIAYLEDESCSISEREIAEYVYEKHSPIITNENIHLYYTCMSSIHKADHKEILNICFKARNKVIEEHLSIDLFFDGLSKFETVTSIDGTFIIAQDIFGIEDKLQAIDDYMEKINDSEQYKAHLSSLRKDA